MFKMKTSSSYIFVLSFKSLIGKIKLSSGKKSALKLKPLTIRSTPRLTFVNQLLDIHLLYSRGQQRVKNKYKSEGRGTCWLDVTVIGADRPARWYRQVLTDVSRTVCCSYLSLRCHWCCRLWPAAGSAGTQSLHLWKPEAAGALRFLPVEDKVVGCEPAWSSGFLLSS